MLSNHVSNGRKATHVQVVSDQQNTSFVMMGEEYRVPMKMLDDLYVDL